MSQYYRIAVATPLRRTFVYLPPAQSEPPLDPVGCRVQVPFGHQTLVGVILAVEHSLPDDVNANKLKPLLQFLDAAPIVSADMLSFYLWAAQYYQSGPGDVLMQCLPSRARQPKPLVRSTETLWQLTAEGKAFDPEQLGKRAAKQGNVLAALRAQGQMTHAQIQAADLTTAQCRALEKKGLVSRIEAVPEAEHAGVSAVPLTLNNEQQTVATALAASLNQFGCHLIEGVTGSGKTEVYLSLIQQVLAAGKQVILLVPEIGLTPQTFDRIQRHLNTRLGLFHSGLTDRDRANTWMDMASGRLRITLGTRSAIFLPMASPGVIVLDEEHDSSYKQQDSFRYHARDLAIKRASSHNIPIILGSATPSLESLLNCQRGRSQHHALSKPAVAARPANIELIDLTQHQHASGISIPVQQRMSKHLQRGEQVMLFLNRRGFSPTLMCHTCGWIAGCPHCDARMTLHNKPPRLLCHHCNHQLAIPHACPSCRSRDLHALGQGTARTEDSLTQLFPNTQVIRVDRDAIRSAAAFEQELAPVHAGDPCILVGTQMLAKGHDFPRVTLVVILDADAGLFSSDFRAAEKSAQLLTQVAGRSGRGNLQGHVLVQTWHPTHPIFGYLQMGGYGAFARDHLLPQREQADLPPYQAMAMIRADAKQAQQAWDFLTRVRALVPDDINQTGPFPAMLAKRAGYHRFWLSLQCRSRKQLQHVLTHLCDSIDSQSLAGGISWGIDVDPVDMG